MTHRIARQLPIGFGIGMPTARQDIIGGSKTLAQGVLDVFDEEGIEGICLMPRELGQAAGDRFVGGGLDHL